MVPTLASTFDKHPWELPLRALTGPEPPRPRAPPTPPSPLPPQSATEMCRIQKIFYSVTWHSPNSACTGAPEAHEAPLETRWRPLRPCGTGRAPSPIRQGCSFPHTYYPLALTTPESTTRFFHAGLAISSTCSIILDPDTSRPFPFLS